MFRQKEFPCSPSRVLFIEGEGYKTRFGIGTNTQENLSVACMKSVFLNYTTRSYTFRYSCQISSGVNLFRIPREEFYTSYDSAIQKPLQRVGRFYEVIRAIYIDASKNSTLQGERADLRCDAERCCDLLYSTDQFSHDISSVYQTPKMANWISLYSIISPYNLIY